MYFGPSTFLKMILLLGLVVLTSFLYFLLSWPLFIGLKDILIG